MNAREAIVTEALSWLGTPYHHHGRKKGVGVDCAMLLAEVFERAGAIRHVDPGFYPHDWHSNMEEELFEKWLERMGARRVQTPGLGDVGVWQFGRTYSHGSIVVAEDGELVHALIKRKVERIRTCEAPLAGHDVHWWSVFA